MNYKLFPFGISFIRKLIENKLYKFHIPQVLENHRIKTTSKIQFGLWLLWPTSSSKKSSNVVKEISHIPSILETADKMFETGKYVECYDILINETTDDVEIKWRVCRALYNMAKDAKNNNNLKTELISEAYGIISEELEKNSENFLVQKWYALILDARSSNEGIQAKIEQLENVKKHMDLAVTLNPNDASLLHMLGEWCFQLTEMPWHQRKTADAFFAKLPYSSYEDALEYYLRAEEAQPRFYSINLLRLGYCYLKLNKPDQARYYLRLAASYPAKSDDDHHANKEAAELLKKLK